MASTIGLTVWKNSCDALGSTSKVIPSPVCPEGRSREGPERFSISKRSGRVGGSVMTHLMKVSPISVERRSSDIDGGTFTSILVPPVNERSLLQVSSMIFLRPLCILEKTRFRPR